jgi:hypothetical protein
MVSIQRKQMREMHNSENTSRPQFKNPFAQLFFAETFFADLPTYQSNSYADIKSKHLIWVSQQQATDVLSTLRI